MHSRTPQGCASLQSRKGTFRIEYSREKRGRGGILARTVRKGLAP